MNPRKRNADTHEAEWIAEEDAFVLQQAYKKAQIRVKEGRAKPIDCLAVALWLADDENRNPLDCEASDSELNVPDPETVLDDLDNNVQLQELEKDLSVFTSLEGEGARRDFWDAVAVACQNQRQQARDDNVRAARGVSNVSDKVGKLFKSKSYDELVALEKQIKTKLRSNEPVDTDYWQSILAGLTSWKAKAKLRTTARKTSRLEMDTFRAQQRESARKATSKRQQAVLERGAAEEDTSLLDSDDASKGVVAAARPISDDSTPPDGPATNFAKSGNLEETLKDEGLPSSDDPTLQKPKYSGRALMGFEWNKYNQTHYDSENPPPKVVQGYEFSIHYPDLVGTGKAPTFKIVRDHGRKRGQMSAPAGEEDRCKIVFKAGRPYQDLVFKIVDREWDYSAKRDRGFESVFEGVGLTNSTFRMLALTVQCRAFYGCIFILEG